MRNTYVSGIFLSNTWWRHQMEIFSALLARWAGNSPVIGEFPSQRSVTRSFDVFFDLCVNKRLSKQWLRQWFVTLSCSLWRHCNVSHYSTLMVILPMPCWGCRVIPFLFIFSMAINIEKNITCKNIGQFQFCINLLPLELIWRSASCPRHWNQRWFGDAAFTKPSGKQWDHMSPWPPSWLSAGIDECCRSANESGHQWLKNSWLETIWH